MLDDSIFDDLFVLEMTNNHLGSIDRGLQIIRDHSAIAHKNRIRAAIKLQFRDLDSFVHKDYISRFDINYICRVMETQMSKDGYAKLVEAIRKSGCIAMATPFDEASVDWCLEFEMPIIKVASVDINDWLLLQKIATANKPVIVSTGGASLEEIDNVVDFFERKGLPLAINHCVAAYPTEDNELQLNQISFLKRRYPLHAVGFSSHEHNDWTSSMMIAYAKGARLFERHIDINKDGGKLSAYSSLPEQIDLWFKAFLKAKEMCGDTEDFWKPPNSRETQYLKSHSRGFYAKTDLVEGQVLSYENVYLAIPLLDGQLSADALRFGHHRYKLSKQCGKDQPIMSSTVEMCTELAGENKMHEV